MIESSDQKQKEISMMIHLKSHDKEIHFHLAFDWNTQFVVS